MIIPESRSEKKILEPELSPQEAAVAEVDAAVAVATSNLICGVDLGGRRARLCFLEPGDTKHPIMVRFEPETKEARKQGYIGVARWVAAMVPNIWYSTKPICVWFELPFGNNRRAIHQLSVMSGALLSGLDRSAAVEFVTSNECRKLVGLKANSAKSDVVEWATVESDADFRFDDHDADAYVVARAILAHGERHTPEVKGLV